MKIIPISRESGSGGREPGKRLADALQIPCYDHEIVRMAARKSNLSEDNVARVSEKNVILFREAIV